MGYVNREFIAVEPHCEKRRVYTAPAIARAPIAKTESGTATPGAFLNLIDFAP